MSAVAHIPKRLYAFSCRLAEISGGGVSWPVKRPTQGTLDKASLPSTGQRLSLMRGLLGADDLT